MVISAFWITFSALINQKFIPKHDMFHYMLFSFIFSLGALMCQYVSIMVVMKIKGNIEQIIKYISAPLYSAVIVYFLYIIIRNISINNHILLKFASF